MTISFEDLKSFLDVEDRDKRVYVSGPMRGYDLYNFPAFDDAEAYLNKIGLVAISPATLDRTFGVTEHTPETELPPFSEMIGRDIAILCTCSQICFLPGWQKSTGAKIEAQVATWLTLAPWYLDTSQGIYYDMTNVPAYMRPVK